MQDIQKAIRDVSVFIMQKKEKKVLLCVIIGTVTLTGVALLLCQFGPKYDPGTVNWLPNPVLAASCMNTAKKLKERHERERQEEIDRQKRDLRAGRPVDYSLNIENEDRYIEAVALRREALYHQVIGNVLGIALVGLMIARLLFNFELHYHYIGIALLLATLIYFPVVKIGKIQGRNWACAAIYGENWKVDMPKSRAAWDRINGRIR